MNIFVEKNRANLSLAGIFLIMLTGFFNTFQPQLEIKREPFLIDFRLNVGVSNYYWARLTGSGFRIGKWSECLMHPVLD